MGWMFFSSQPAFAFRFEYVYTHLRRYGLNLLLGLSALPEVTQLSFPITTVILCCREFLALWAGHSASVQNRRMAMNIQTTVPLASTGAAVSVYGTGVAGGEGYVTFVPLAEELLPITGTVMLNCAQIWPKSVLKAKTKLSQ
jgi:hypothetical protein